MSVKQSIKVTNAGLSPILSVAQGTGAIEYEFTVSDFDIPSGSAAVAYNIQPTGNIVSQTCSISGNTITIKPPAYYFLRGKNYMQFQVSRSNEDLFSFLIEVWCAPNISQPEVIVAENPSLVSQLISDVGLLSAQLDNLLSIPSGSLSTSSDAALADIKIGYDGTTYDTPGDAVRGQASSLSEDINELPKNYYGHKHTFDVDESTPIDGTARLNFPCLIRAGKTYTVNMENYTGEYLTAFDFYIGENNIDFILVGRWYVKQAKNFSFTSELDKNTLQARPFFSQKESSNLTLSVRENDSLGYALNEYANNPSFGEIVNEEVTKTSTIRHEYNIQKGEKYFVKLLKYDGSNLKTIDIYTAYNNKNNSELYGQLQFVGASIVFSADKDATQLSIYVSQKEAENATIELYIEKLITEIDYSLYKNVGNLLVIGDSYSAQGYWLNKLKNIIKINNVKRVAVGSSTIKDKYTDRNTYPYTSRPNQSENSGNLNTFSCQIEKLKRLISGTDLDDGETKYTTIPDTIFIQGGHNDSADDSVENYKEQLYEKQENKYITVNGEISQSTVYVKKSVDIIDRTNFMGAIRYLYESLSEIYPNARIYVITPSGLSYATGNNINYLEKADQIKYACSLLSLPVIDWSVNGRLTFIDTDMTGTGTEEDPYNPRSQSRYSDDSLHPNDGNGSVLLAECTANAL